MKVKQKNSAARRSEAFTLMEVAVSIIIVAIGAAGLMSCMSYGFMTVQRVRENQRATQILLEKSETIRLYSWDQVTRPGFIPATFTATYDGVAASSDYKGTVYHGLLRLSDFPYASSYADRMKMLTLSLRWNSQNTTRTRMMTTYIAKDGIQNYVY